jgi:hypothetical protein
MLANFGIGTLGLVIVFGRSLGVDEMHATAGMTYHRHDGIALLIGGVVCGEAPNSTQ